jgi:hypothetical protein
MTGWRRLPERGRPLDSLGDLCPRRTSAGTKRSALRVELLRADSSVRYAGQARRCAQRILAGPAAVIGDDRSRRHGPSFQRRSNPRRLADYPELGAIMDDRRRPSRLGDRAHAEPSRGVYRSGLIPGDACRCVRAATTGQTTMAMNFVGLGWFVRETVPDFTSDIALDRLPNSPVEFNTPLFAEHPAHEIGGILRTEFPHDVRSVKFDGARADAERARGLLARGPAHDLHQRHALARRQ